MTFKEALEKICETRNCEIETEDLLFAISHHQNNNIRKLLFIICERNQSNMSECLDMSFRYVLSDQCDEDLLIFLLERISISLENVDTLLEPCVEYHHLKALDLIMKQANKQEYYDHLLSLALKHCNPEVFEYALSKRANTHSVDSKILKVACLNGSLPLIEDLLEREAYE